MDPLRPKYQPVGLDLSAEQCRSLTAFVASLPAPQAMQPLSRRQRNNVTRGRQLFATVGCAACHAERVGDIDGIYSDLLLHDMGPGLADPVLAQPTLVLIKQRGPAADDQ